MKTERDVLTNTLHTTITGTGRVQGDQTGNWSGLHILLHLDLLLPLLGITS